jgi:hypothetical protein
VEFQNWLVLHSFSSPRTSFQTSAVFAAYQHVFIVANPVTMLDNALAILRGGKTSSLNREMEKHYLSDPGIIRSESSTSPLIVCSLVGLISILTEFEALLYGSSYSFTR